jgi:hypothetical protein
MFAIAAAAIPIPFARLCEKDVVLPVKQQKS